MTNQLCNKSKEHLLNIKLGKVFPKHPLTNRFKNPEGYASNSKPKPRRKKKDATKKKNNN